MSLSRGLHLFRRIDTTLRKPIASQVQQVRNSGGLFSYRCGGYPPRKLVVYGSQFLMGFTWWWILWHLWQEPDHITGEFPYPDPKLWTNEELGIPEDDEP
ncbi:NADH dehydrogenase [ubiquinone] 1 beta subcomplex subunit 2, mitochondrial-like [Cimex lectularius]|uniref:NADH dehydrogenase [ubiquinone] 1 beta subcomplex subunit 2, mitochondrial n=1 Tax=Cimex lectularius TaxID=79782 RepID=A0A8I6SE39_CIMLE|nr:NADH dehydrogenase [ubiquinone] 1 beta subcomplex subunit 2, mitochondrial-like [Cimex lectularius]